MKLLSLLEKGTLLRVRIFLIAPSELQDTQTPIMLNGCSDALNKGGRKHSGNWVTQSLLKHIVSVFQKKIYIFLQVLLRSTLLRAGRW